MLLTHDQIVVSERDGLPLVGFVFQTESVGIETIRTIIDLVNEVGHLRPHPIFEVPVLQSDDDTPGLFIGFKNAEQRAEALKYFRVAD